ncbi:dihydrofolate reductase [Verrucosispora sp. WMMD1129]|uniref:dihydrofolate reductase family protein n=1 Tax=Verrucosispora sp. WMMD1129 TaxID=3016093 RepID=UPI00249C29C1|nr:dihydrofolate reductase [Verrucosispora sp. WMMD1129]WFE43366.1 dihydrofolate reductase [Verrucosispora sp. WMMD1129]
MESLLRRLTYYVATTLDGFIAGPDGGDPSGQSYFPVPADLIDYMVTNFPETLPAPARAALGVEGPGKVFDTVLEGRASYQLGLDAGLDDAYPHLRHLVFSTTLRATPGNAVELVRTDALDRVRSLKQDGSELDIWLVGGGTLAHSLLPEIDRLIIKQHPSVIGSGIPMFAGPFQPTLFTHVDAAVLDSGVRVLTLDRS